MAPMSLESLLAPFKWVDNQVAKGFSKISEPLGNDFSTISGLILDLVGVETMKYSYHFIEQYFANYELPFYEPTLTGDIATTAFFMIPSLLFHDLLYSAARSTPFGKMAVGPQLSDRFTEFSEKLQKGVRLPVMGLACFYGYKVASGLLSGVELSPPYVMGVAATIVTGCLASSMYLKAEKPELGRGLKDLAKDAFDSIKDILPEKQPEPIPIKYSPTTL